MKLDEINLKKEINNKIDKVFSVIDSVSKNRDQLIKTASTTPLEESLKLQDEEIKISTNVKDIIEAKESKDNNSDNDLEEERITIVSKEIKDPNYEVYITKVAVTKNGEKIFMVSFFLRDLYLGRYLINRNLYFLKTNHNQAKKAFKDFIAKSKEVRDDYYNEECLSIKIPIELQNYAIEKTGDFDYKNEDTLGTSVQRQHFNESTVYEWFRSNNDKLQEQRKYYDSDGDYK